MIFKDCMGYPLVNVYIAMENHRVQWLNPLFQWAIFNSSVNVYQRVYPMNIPSKITIKISQKNHYKIPHYKIPLNPH